MKKVYITCIFILLVLGLGILVFIPKNSTKFSFDDIHYNTLERFISIDSLELNKLIEDKKSFAVFTYLPYCTFSIPCDVVFETFLNENNLSFYSIPYDEFSKVKCFDGVKYAPSVILVNNGNIVAYLDANSDADLKMYQDSKEFGNWISKYVNLKNYN